MVTDGFVREWEPLALTIGRCFYAPGHDRDDLDQEARIALLEAAVAWEPERGATFRRFLITVVERRMIDFVKAARRPARLRLAEAVRVFEADGDIVDALEALPAPARTDPVEILHAREQLRIVLDTITGRLTATERLCLLAVADGHDQVTIQRDLLGRPTGLFANGRPRAKAVDNALQRANAKLRAALKDAA